MIIISERIKFYALMGTIGLREKTGGKSPHDLGLWVMGREVISQTFYTIAITVARHTHAEEFPFLQRATKDVYFSKPIRQEGL